MIQKRKLVRISAWAALAIALASQAMGRDCADTLRIENSSPLHFGSIAVPEGGGGLVILSPTGATASVGRISAGINAHPGVVQLCGRANAGFVLTLEPLRAGSMGAFTAHGAHVVRSLDIRALAGHIRPDFEGQWSGRLGRQGTAELRVGGTLLVPRGRENEILIAPFEVTVTAVD